MLIRSDSLSGLTPNLGATNWHVFSSPVQCWTLDAAWGFGLEVYVDYMLKNSLWIY